MTRATLATILENNAKKGLASANRGNPFWTKGDAMRAFNEIRAAKRA